MFGWPCCFVNGNLFFGLYKQSMIFRLPESDFREFLRDEGAMHFEPMPGRKNKGFVAATGEMLEDGTALAHWMARARSMPGACPTSLRKRLRAARSPNDRLL